MGCGFSSGGQGLGSVFGAVISLVPSPMRKVSNGPGDEASAVMYKTQRKKHQSCFSHSKRSAVQLPLDRVFVP